MSDEVTRESFTASAGGAGDGGVCAVSFQRLKFRRGNDLEPIRPPATLERLAWGAEEESGGDGGADETDDVPAGGEGDDLPVIPLGTLGTGFDGRAAFASLLHSSVADSDDGDCDDDIFEDSLELDLDTLRLRTPVPSLATPPPSSWSPLNSPPVGSGGGGGGSYVPTSPREGAASPALSLSGRKREHATASPLTRVHARSRSVSHDHGSGTPRGGRFRSHSEQGLCAPHDVHALLPRLDLPPTSSHEYVGGGEGRVSPPLMFSDFMTVRSSLGETALTSTAVPVLPHGGLSVVGLLGGPPPRAEGGTLLSLSTHDI